MNATFSFYESQVGGRYSVMNAVMNASSRLVGDILSLLLLPS